MPIQTVAARAFIAALVMLFIGTTAQAHGGGCRKSSPPGQCCHMDNSTGQPHCH
jgi:hypothetical protein